MIYLLADEKHRTLLTPSVIVSVISLFFTIGSFWWLFARRGKLVVYEPHSFSALVSTSLVLFLRFPLVLESTGPRSIIIQNMRLSFPDEPNSTLALPWRSTRRSLKVDPSDDHQYPSAFAIPGRSADTHFIEFGGPFPGFALEKIDYRILLEIKIGHKDGWQSALEFTLHAGNISFPDQYITYGNSDIEPTPADREKSKAALQRIIDTLEEARSKTQTENQN